MFITHQRAKQPMQPFRMTWILLFGSLFFSCFILSTGVMVQLPTDIGQSLEYSAIDTVYYRSAEYTGQSANVSRLLDSLLTGYDKRLRPRYKESPVQIGVTMFIYSLSSISEVDMDVTLDMYFRQYWQEPRLAFDDDDELCISNEMLERIWWPDTFFANAKNAKFHSATTKNAFLRIKPNGAITLSLRLTVTAQCNMDLTYFPMDSQKCTLEIESYGYSVDDIQYSWKDGLDKSVEIKEDAQLPQFTVIGHRLVSKLQTLSTGNYSRLSCVFYFERSLGYYVIQIYVPSILIVVLSWVSFWLSSDAVPARVALGITTVLTMTTLISSTNAALPKISYLKSIDVYLVTCFFMVFASLLEYAAVSYLSNRCKRKRGENSTIKALLEATPTPALLDGEEALRLLNGSFARKASERQISDETGRSLCADYDVHTKQSHSHMTPEMMGQEMTSSSCYNSGGCRNAVEKIDFYSRIFFPLMFVTFNILYWFIYLRISAMDISQLEDFVPTMTNYQSKAQVS